MRHSGTRVSGGSQAVGGMGKGSASGGQQRAALETKKKYPKAKEIKTAFIADVKE